MEHLEKCLQELKNAVNSKVKDQSLVTEFSNCLQTIKMDQNLVNPYCRVLFTLYDLSNNHFFISGRREQGRVHLDEMALAMKMCVLRMLSRMVMFFNDHPHLDQPLELTRESLQIMVLLSRVFLDLGKTYSTEIKQIYPLCVTFYDAFPQELPLQLNLIHCVNIIQLLKFNVDGGCLDIQQFRRLLEIFFTRSKSYNGSCNYLEFVQCIAFQVVLKLLKKGAREQAALITHYLTQKMIDTINSLTRLDPKIIGQDNSLFKVSPFYELYLQIKESGIDNISEERLRLFISKEEHFKDARLFDVVALTSQTLPLEIWFELNLSSKVKNDLISMAYRCFVFVVDSHLQCSQSNLDNPTELLVKFQADQLKLIKLLRLAQVVMLNLLSQKKEQGEPLINILKRLIKILVQMVVTLYPQTQAIRQYADKIQLICSKHGLSDLSRSITCVSFYYELIMGIASDESYNRFTKTHLLDKSSQLFKIIKLAYEFQSNKYQPNDAEQRQLLNNQPYLAILFQKDIRASAILKLHMSCFSKLPEKYEIYFLLLNGFLKLESTSSADLLELATHMEECLIMSDYSSINRLDIKYLADIEKIWLKILQNQKYKGNAGLNVKIAIVLLYLVSIRLFLTKIVTLNMGILLNRYSKILKILSFVMDEIASLQPQQQKKAIELYQYLSKSILSWCLQKLKMQPKEQEGGCEAGYLVLIDMLHQSILKHEVNPQVAQFFKFVRFQIQCITDSVGENQISCEKNIKLLKLYCSSIFIKKPVKLKILRRLIREDLINDSRHASLAELSDLIALTEDNKEKKLYAEYMIRSFGQQGKKYLLLHSSINSSNLDFLQQLGDSQIDDF